MAAAPAESIVVPTSESSATTGVSESSAVVAPAPAPAPTAPAPKVRALPPPAMNRAQLAAQDAALLQPNPAKPTATAAPAATATAADGDAVMAGVDDDNHSIVDQVRLVLDFLLCFFFGSSFNACVGW